MLLLDGGVSVDELWCSSYFDCGPFAKEGLTCSKTAFVAPSRSLQLFHSLWTCEEDMENDFPLDDAASSFRPGSRDLLPFCCARIALAWFLIMEAIVSLCSLLLTRCWLELMELPAIGIFCFGFDVVDMMSCVLLTLGSASVP